MPTHDRYVIKALADAELHEEDRKAAIKLEKERLRKIRKSFFKKRITFHWPIRITDKHAVHNRRHNDAGKY